MKYTTKDQLDLRYSSPKEVIQKIQNAFAEYGETNVSFEVDYEYDYGDSVSVKCYLECTREMTSKEKEKYLREKEKLERQQEDFQRMQYETLKRKFEK